MILKLLLMKLDHCQSIKWFSNVYHYYLSHFLILKIQIRFCLYQLPERKKRYYSIECVHLEGDKRSTRGEIWQSNSVFEPAPSLTIKYAHWFPYMSVANSYITLLNQILHILDQDNINMLSHSRAFEEVYTMQEVGIGNEAQLYSSFLPK